MENNKEKTIEECKEIILSNDYADFIIEFSGNVEDIKKRFDPACIQIISNKFASFNVLRDKNKMMNFEEYGYYSFPKLYGLLDSSNMEDSGILKLQRQPYLNLKGENVLIGIIDTGIDYLHQAFKNSDGSTRIISIWDQTIQIGKAPKRLGYGSEYTKIDIDKALESDKPLEIVPSVDTVGHGTFMAGIAAGGVDTENDFIGAAPLSNLVVVKLKEAKEYLKEFYFVQKDAICYQENDIMMGVKYLLRIAEILERPLVICIGVGTSLGDHNGTSNIDEYINVIADTSGIVIVAAAGNEGNRGHHYLGIDKENEPYEDVEIKVGENERGFTLELWTQAPNLYSIGMISPGGEFVDKIPARIGQSTVINFLFEPTIVYVDYSVVETRSGDELILMRFDTPVPGIWKIRVYRENDYLGEYNMWLPMEQFISEETFFVKPEPYITLCDPTTARNPISVSAYNHINGSLYINASKGYTSGGSVKPDIVAPGVNVYGPIPGGKYSRKTGTSIAAAHVAGGAALFLEWGIVRKNDLNMDTIDVKKYMIKGAIRTSGIYPNREFGYGKLNVYNAFKSLIMTI